MFQSEYISVSSRKDINWQMVTARAPEKLTHISLLLVQTPTDTDTTPKLTYNDGHIRGALQHDCGEFSENRYKVHTYIHMYIV